MRWGSGGTSARRATRWKTPDERVPRAISDAAWLSAIPCALALAAALVLLGPPLGGLLRTLTPSISLLPADPGALRPEQRETATYLIALTGPLLLVVAITALVHRRPRPSEWRVRPAAVTGVQALVLAFVAVCFAAQHQRVWWLAYFTPASLVAAAAIAGGVVLVAPHVRRWLWPRTRWQHYLPLVLAATAAAVWLLPAVNTERSITWSLFSYDTAFPFDETFAVLNGLTPPANFTAQYATLLPYVAAVPMVAFGKTLLVFTTAMCALSALVLLAVYDLLRRAARSGVLGLLLFMPVLATSLFDSHHVGAVQFTTAMYFGMMPLRYAGPFILACLRCCSASGSPPARSRRRPRLGLRSTASRRRRRAPFRCRPDGRRRPLEHPRCAPSSVRRSNVGAAS